MRALAVDDDQRQSSFDHSERHLADCVCVHGNGMRALAVDDDQRQSVDDSLRGRVMETTKDIIIAMFRT